MSGYLEVKYPIKSNLGLNPFKQSWKRQWCILRPSATFCGGVLAVYCSEAGEAAGCVELPRGCVVRRAKSRSRIHAFAVFPPDERKPRVLLAAATHDDALHWMEKIKTLINATDDLDTIHVKDSYSVSVVETELSRRVGLGAGDGCVCVCGAGLRVSRGRAALCVQWRRVAAVALSLPGPRCRLDIDGDDTQDGGWLELVSPLSRELEAAISAGVRRARNTRALSRSDPDLPLHTDKDEVRRSWCGGPSEVSLDDLHLVMSKDCSAVPVGSLCRYDGSLLPHYAPRPAEVTSIDESMSDRRSVASVASGIYEEIPDVPNGHSENSDTRADVSDAASEQYCVMTRPKPAQSVEEPTYEAVGECACSRGAGAGVADCSRGAGDDDCVESRATGYCGARRRRHPPPLPPRHYTLEWSVSRHESLWALPPPGAGAPEGDARQRETRTLPRWDRSRQAFTAFRKRLKSDSRAVVSPKSDTSKDKDVETKKKKFDFTPTRDIFKNFRVGRKMKNLKITTKLAKGETKSCEFLDEPEHITTKRCSKSVECLESSDEYLDRFEEDLSMNYHNDTVEALSLPKEIVDLIIKENILLKDPDLTNLNTESDYMPMSPVVPTPQIEHHYIAMSPRTNIA